MRTRFAGRTTVRVTRKPHAPTVIRVDTFGISFSYALTLPEPKGKTDFVLPRSARAFATAASCSGPPRSSESRMSTIELRIATS